MEGQRNLRQEAWIQEKTLSFLQHDIVTETEDTKRCGMQAVALFSCCFHALSWQTLTTSFSKTMQRTNKSVLKSYLWDRTSLGDVELEAYNPISMQDQSCPVSVAPITGTASAAEPSRHTRYLQQSSGHLLHKKTHLLCRNHTERKCSDPKFLKNYLLFNRQVLTF